MKRNAFLSTALLIISLPSFSGDARAQNEEGVPRVEVGAQFSSLSVNIPERFDAETRIGLGGRVTYNFSRYFAAEAEGNFYPEKTTLTSLTTGGRAVQGQFGVKVGKRFERFGLFAKARPGFVSYSGVAVVTGTETVVADLSGITFTFPVFERRRRTHFSTDLGGVLEFYPSRRLVTRFDFGDTIIRYGEHKIPGPIRIGPGTQTVIVSDRPAQTKHNFQFTAGVGFRF